MLNAFYCINNTTGNDNNNNDNNDINLFNVT